MNTQVLHFVNPVTTPGQEIYTTYDIAEKLRENDLEQIADCFKLNPITIMVEVADGEPYQRYMPTVVVIDLEGTDKITLSVESEGIVSLYNFRVNDNGDLFIRKEQGT